eukprot:TRINITY_DN14103_c0_g1_i1.p2 TRINITY_DN14103_c0_g1~~TRINITY_DN14103_c0_g1_i1.p2  ORF type:complete len:116 (-),score=14.93 TRINITY_DN14103_c0_g1_i1:115-462(-)
MLQSKCSTSSFETIFEDLEWCSSGASTSVGQRTSSSCGRSSGATGSLGASNTSGGRMVAHASQGRALHPLPQKHGATFAHSAKSLERRTLDSDDVLRQLHRVHRARELNAHVERR